MHGGSGLSVKELSRLYRSQRGGKPAPSVTLTEDLAFRICNAIYNVENLNIRNESIIDIRTLDALRDNIERKVTVDSVIRIILGPDPSFEAEGELDFLRRRVEIAMFHPADYDNMV